MTRINAKVKAYAKNRSYSFSDGWDFDIGGYKFTKQTNHEIQIEFNFDSELEHDDELFGRVTESPHDLNEDLLRAEYELELLLDVISLHISNGLRLDPSSYVFTHKDGSSRNSSSASLSVFEHDDIAVRFESMKVADESLVDALRFYRLNLLEEDSGERTTQLWGIIERLYGKQPNQPFLDDEETKWLKDQITSTKKIDESKKQKLIDGIKSINPVNTLDLLADKIKLRNVDGTLSDKEKKILLRNWKKLRGYQGHGEYLLRNENLEEVLWDLEDTVELLLENNITPKMYMVVVFQDGTLSENWKKTPSHKKIGDWNFTPVRGSRLKDELSMLEHHASDQGRVYLILHNRTYLIEGRSSEACNLNDVDQIVRNEATRIQEDMNNNEQG